MRPMPALIVKVVTDAPEFGHAEIVVRPRPAPRDVRTTVRARAAKAPAKIAAQLTAEYEASLPTAATRPAEPAGTCPCSVPEQRKDDDDRNRHAEQPKQNSAAHNGFLQFYNAFWRRPM